MKLYQKLATLVLARANCIGSGNHEWEVRHGERLRWLVENMLPRGGGFDAGTKIDFEAQSPDRLVLQTSFHHMNAAGYYDGWTEHRVIIRPSLAYDIDIHVGGRNRNDIKDYIAEAFHVALYEEVDEEKLAEVA